MSRWPFQRKVPAPSAPDALSQAQALIAELLQFTPEQVARAASTGQGRKQLRGVIQELQAQLAIVDPMVTDLRGIMQRLEAAIALAEGGFGA